MPLGLDRILVAARFSASLSARRFLMFVGYPRSGHSLVGQLLNAHPQALIAHELDAGRLVADHGFDRSRLFKAIIARDRAAAAVGYGFIGYDYAVPGGWQGKTWRPLVMGDKKGGGTSVVLREHPDLIKQVTEAVGLPVSVVHVLRDPLDNIASMLRHSEHGRILRSTNQWLRQTRTVEAARERGDWSTWTDLRLDDLIADPRGELERLRSDLGLAPCAPWLEAAAGRVADQPLRSRHRVEWTEAALRRLDRAGWPVHAAGVAIAGRTPAEATNRERRAE